MDWRAELLEEMEDDEFDDNGLPGCDPSSQGPDDSVEDRGLQQSKSITSGNEEETEDDNGVVSSFKREDDSNVDEIPSSAEEKQEDSGGTIQTFREQDTISKLDERVGLLSAETSHGDYASLPESKRCEDFTCGAHQDGECGSESSSIGILGSSNNSDQQGTNNKFDDTVADCEVPAALSSIQADCSDSALTRRKDERSCYSLVQKTPEDESCPTEKIPDIQTDSNEDETASYEKQIDQYKEVDIFDTGTVLPSTAPESRRNEVTVAPPDGETAEFDPEPNRDVRKGSFRLTRQDSDERQITRQHDAGPSEVAARGSSEKTGKHSANSSFKLNLLGIIFAFSGFFFNRGIEAILTVTPGDILASSGSVARLRCSTNYSSPIYWERILFGSYDQETIYYGKNGMAKIAGDRVSVDMDPASGSYDLVITNVHLEDAGTYICIDEAGLGESYRGQLVVSERLTCEMSVPGTGFMGENIFDLPEDAVEVTCSLEFRGNVAPRFQWIWGKATTPLVTSTNVINGSTVTSAVKLRAVHDMDGDRLTCLAIVSTDVTSSPDNPSLRWISEAVSVRYVHLMFGSVAECQSSALIPICNPNCTYRVQKESDGKCQCLAVYHDQDNNYNKIFNEYSCDISVWQQNGAIIVVVVIVSTAAIAATVSAIIATRRIKLQRKKRAPQKEDLMEGQPGIGASFANDNKSETPLMIRQT